LRYLGCVVGFGFGVVWMTVGLGSAIVCLLLAALGYGAVLMAERAQSDGLVRGPATETTEVEAAAVPLDGLEPDEDEPYDDVPDDATTPLAAEAEYGWPWPPSHEQEHAEEAHAP
jgi:hypothetical protein